jgi:hypothetical protein
VHYIRSVNGSFLFGANIGDYFVIGVLKYFLQSMLNIIPIIEEDKKEIICYVHDLYCIDFVPLDYDKEINGNIELNDSLII